MKIPLRAPSPAVPAHGRTSFQAWSTRLAIWSVSTRVSIMPAKAEADPALTEPVQ